MINDINKYKIKVQNSTGCGFMEKLFTIKDLVFYKEDFLDNIEEFEDVIHIIKEFSHKLNYEELEVVEENDCCGRTKKNYFIEIQGFLNEYDEFITREELGLLVKERQSGLLVLFVIRIYKCLACRKWIIDILE